MLKTEQIARDLMIQNQKFTIYNSKTVTSNIKNSKNN